MAFNDRNKPVAMRKYDGVRHMKTVFRSGVNPATATFVAGSNVRIRKQGRRY